MNVTPDPYNVLWKLNNVNALLDTLDYHAKIVTLVTTEPKMESTSVFANHATVTDTPTSAMQTLDPVW